MMANAVRVKKFVTQAGTALSLRDAGLRSISDARDAIEAVEMWNAGKGTAEIALALNLKEHVVYNNLPRWRGVK
jgi:hypothetical protein